MSAWLKREGQVLGNLTENRSNNYLPPKPKRGTKQVRPIAVSQGEMPSKMAHVTSQYLPCMEVEGRLHVDLSALPRECQAPIML